MHGACGLHHRDVRAGRTAKCATRVLPSGLAALDVMLPDAGWPRGGVVEMTVAADCHDSIGLFQPALARLARQGRRLAVVAPPYRARRRLFRDPALHPDRLLQINPHPGRSTLWTVESLLRSGDCGAVLAWPGCNTELVDKRLSRAACEGRALAVLFRPPCSVHVSSGVSLRLRLESDDAGRVLYLVDGRGERLSGLALDDLLY